ncbi:MAG: hypothetical protein ABIP33_02180 [Pseudolysinimonas sp.]
MNSEDAGLPSTSSALEIEYRKLMRWYPRRWRGENEEAMLGALLDQAEHDRRDHPTEAERSALRREGLAHWFGLPLRGQRLRLVPLIAGAALSVFYSAFIIWSPSTNYPGSIGPFSNPSIITCILLVIALISGLLVRGRVASVLALAAAAAEIAIGLAAAAHPTMGPSPWEGPSISTVVLFTGIAILSGLSLGRGWGLAAGSLLVLAGTAAMVLVSFVQAALGQFSTASIGLVVFVVAAVAIAIVLIVRHRNLGYSVKATSARD